MGGEDTIHMWRGIEHGGDKERRDGSRQDAGGVPL